MVGKQCITGNTCIVGNTLDTLGRMFKPLYLRFWSSMALRRIRDLGGGAGRVSAGVVLPKEDLPDELFREVDGREELDETYAKIERVDEDGRQFVVELV